MNAELKKIMEYIPGEGQIRHSGDGFAALKLSLAEILCLRGITALPAESGGELECRLFFDDWYIYSLEGEGESVCSLFKMREQEHDAAMGLYADGDIPGVTVSFIAMELRLLADCLEEPTEERRRLLAREIDRVVARGGQRHHAALKKYFVRPEARAPYLIAEMYTDFIASLAEEGSLAVPELYGEEFRKKGAQSRLCAFIEENNRVAGRQICDHGRIYFSGSGRPAAEERLAILATHTGNCSFHSFAAEVRFHARFLSFWARLPLPVLGRSPYSSAIRADMSIGDAEMKGPTPYYRESSRGVKAQKRCHGDRILTEDM